jgi:hypothetical protein
MRVVWAIVVASLVAVGAAAEEPVPRAVVVPLLPLPPPPIVPPGPEAVQRPQIEILPSPYDPAMNFGLQGRRNATESEAKRSEGVNPEGMFCGPLSC